MWITILFPSIHASFLLKRTGSYLFTEGAQQFSFHGTNAFYYHIRQLLPIHTHMNWGLFSHLSSPWKYVTSTRAIYPLSYLYIYIHVYIYIYMYMYIVHIYSAVVCKQRHAYIYICKCTCTFTCTFTYIYKHVSVYILLHYIQLYK